MNERLGIGNDRFLINRLIEQAPRDTMVREFLMNAQEAAALNPHGERTVKIYPTNVDGVPKLTFWNTGPGMSREELRCATDISSSIHKEMSLNENFGIGAKVSGLTVSPFGIRYRSCKEGRVHQVTIGYDEDEKTYVRFAANFLDGSQDVCFDVSQICKQEDKNLDEDWTEVVLFGESEGHDTTKFPIGLDTKVDRSYVPAKIFQRFSSFKEGVHVQIDVSMSQGGGKDETSRFRSIKTLSQILPDLPRTEQIKDNESGIRVLYIHDPKKGNHSTSSTLNAAAPSTTFCALVYKGERYDYHTKKRWSAIAPNYGIPFGSRVLSVEIHLPEHSAMPNQYRDGLTNPNDRSPLGTHLYAHLVRNLMPNWVKDVIRSEHPPSDENLDDLRNDLQRLLDEFRLPTPTITSSPNSQEKSKTDDLGLFQTDTTTEPPIEKNEHGSESGAVEVGQRAGQRKVRMAPEGAVPSRERQALDRIPEIEFLREPDQIDEKGVRGRAGKYYSEAQTLFINCAYPAVERMFAELLPEFADPQLDQEEIRKAVRKASEHIAALRVGKATVFAITKRIVEDWSHDDLERATSPESLSIAADDYRQSFPAARKLIKKELKSQGIQVPTKTEDDDFRLIS